MLGLLTVIGGLALVACGESGDGGDPTGPGDPPAANVPPVASFTADPVSGSAPLQVHFDAGASVDPDGEIVAYEWDFGDGQTATGAAVTHSYANAGEYLPRLEVRDNRGATASAVGDVVRAVTPPGDGIGTISGEVWHDRDGDGVRHPDDFPLEGFALFLDRNGNGVRDPDEPLTFTDAAGAFRFDGVDTGIPQRVMQDLRLGWTNTAAGRVGGSAQGTADPAIPAGAPTARFGAPVTAASAGVPEPSFVIGGTVVAAEEDFPFMVALVVSAVPANQGALTCGGTFVAARWILTAAHCVDGREPEELKVLIQTKDLESGGRRVDIRRITIYPAYGAHSFVGNDLAIMELEESFMIPRIELQAPARAALSAPGSPALAIGWGRTSLGGPISTRLRKVELPLISNEACRTMLGDNIVEQTICAGTQGDTRSICNGDSGGPLMVHDGRGWVQVGLSSFGANCQPPMAFARISPLLSWLRERIPAEASRAVEVEWGGAEEAQVEFGNFR